MSLPTRRLPEHYPFANHAFPAAARRAGLALWRWLCDRRMFLAGLLIGSLVVVYAAMAGIESLAAERDVAVQAAERLAEWHKTNWAQATIQGSPERVANIAGAVAVAVR
jgi:hypothetical protein